MQDYHFGLFVNFFIPYWIYLLFFYLAPIIISLIFTWESKITKKDIKFLCALVLCSSLVVGLFYHFLYFSGNWEHPINVPFSTTFRILFTVILYIFFRKIKSYAVKNSIILAIFVDLAVFISSFPSNILRNIFWNTTVGFNPQSQLFSIFLVMLTCVVATAVAIVAKRLTAKIRNKITSNHILQALFAAGSLLSWAMVEVVWFLFEYGNANTSSLWLNILLLGFAFVSILSFFFYNDYLGAKVAAQQEIKQRESLLFYLQEIEQQQTSIRKFKHDLQNLFSIMDIFVQQGDWAGMAQFYPKVREASSLITKNEFVLEGLSRINVREVKSILLAKFATAQNFGLDTKLEVSEEINVVCVDSISLVRMLGIILDNAIEELVYLGEGQFFVSCFISEDSVNFVVRNNCRESMPPAAQMRQLGFSTKGPTRGIGLNNLHELSSSLPNVVLMTDVNNGIFEQTLIIGDMT